MSYAADADDRRRGPWCGGPYNYGYWRPRPHPAAVILMVLGFIFWWPLGLAMLALVLWSKSMDCWSPDRWQRKRARMEEKMERMRRYMDMWGGQWREPPSSGNKAFDEYRADTLRRLEEEEREFRSFLDRLRAAKDKSEFDQFMADRRDRQAPSPPPA